MPQDEQTHPKVMLAGGLSYIIHLVHCCRESIMLHETANFDNPSYVQTAPASSHPVYSTCYSSLGPRDTPTEPSCPPQQNVKGDTETGNQERNNEHSSEEDGDYQEINEENRVNVLEVIYENSGEDDDYEEIKEGEDEKGRQFKMQNDLSYDVTIHSTTVGNQRERPQATTKTITCTTGIEAGYSKLCYK